MREIMIIDDMVKRTDSKDDNIRTKIKKDYYLFTHE